MHIAIQAAQKRQWISCLFLQKNENYLQSSEKQQSKQMASLRTAFIQTYHSWNTCFSLLTTIPCIVTTLLNSEEDAKPQMENQKKRHSQSFNQIDQLFKLNRERSTWISSFLMNFLLSITNKDSNDFTSQNGEGNCVHALELINDNRHQMEDMKTTLSEMISFDDQDPQSTDISLCSDMSQVEDI